MPAMQNYSAAADPARPIRVEMLVNDLIGRVADKWTLLALEELEELRHLPLTRLAQLVYWGLARKMLTWQTLRAMERDGLVRRTVYPVVLKVEYALIPISATAWRSLCGVWHWAEAHLAAVEAQVAPSTPAPGPRQWCAARLFGADLVRLASVT